MELNLSRGATLACLMAAASPAVAQEPFADVGATVLESDTRMRGSEDRLDVAAVPGDFQVDGEMFVDALEAMTRMLQPAKSPVLLGIGSGVTAPGGTVFASLSGTTRRDGSDDELDGALAFGAGFGDAQANIGVQVTTVISSLTDSFGDSGSLALKFSRALGETTYAGLSFSNVAGWGVESDADVRTTLAVTHYNDFRVNGEYFPVMLTAGYGSHVRQNGSEAGFVLGGGIGLTEHVGASVSTNTDYVNLGVGVAVGVVEGLHLSATLVDAFDQEDRRAGQFALTYAIPDVF